MRRLEHARVVLCLAPRPGIRPDRGCRGPRSRGQGQSRRRGEEGRRRQVSSHVDRRPDQAPHTPRRRRPAGLRSAQTANRRGTEAGRGRYLVRHRPCDGRTAGLHRGDRRARTGAQDRARLGDDPPPADPRLPRHRPHRAGRQVRPARARGRSRRHRVDQPPRQSLQQPGARPARRGRLRCSL